MIKNEKSQAPNSFFNSIFLFLIGGGIYYFLEIFFRGYSHYSMFFAAGLSLVLINIICRKLSFFRNRNVFLKAFVGGCIITFIEFFIGIIFNIFLKQNIWDYTSLPFNILGQICIPFSVLWIILSFPALLICKISDFTFWYSVLKK